MWEGTKAGHKSLVNSCVSSSPKNQWVRVFVWGLADASITLCTLETLSSAHTRVTSEKSAKQMQHNWKDIVATESNIVFIETTGLKLEVVTIEVGNTRQNSLSVLLCRLVNMVVIGMRLNCYLNLVSKSFLPPRMLIFLLVFDYQSGAVCEMNRTVLPTS